MWESGNDQYGNVEIGRFGSAPWVTALGVCPRCRDAGREVDVLAGRFWKVTGQTTFHTKVEWARNAGMWK